MDAPARTRLAQLERECRELRAQLEDARTELETERTSAAAARAAADERGEALRKLEARMAAEREGLERLRLQEERHAELLQEVRRELARVEAARQHEASRAIQLDAELRRLVQTQQDATRAAAAPSAGAPAAETPAQPPVPAAGPISPAAGPAPVSPVTPAPGERPPPAAGQPSGDGLIWTSFCDTLRQLGLLNEGEPLEPAPERLRRLGVLAAGLMRFQGEVERMLIAQLEELKRRNPQLQEPYDVLQYYQRGERVWLWALTERAGRQVVPERHYDVYLSHLSRMNYALLTAYLRTLTYDVSQRARLLLDPAALRRDSGTTRKDGLWDHFEQRAWSTIPRRLSDACLGGFAELVHRIYHLDTDSG